MTVYIPHCILNQLSCSSNKHTHSVDFTEYRPRQSAPRPAMSTPNPGKHPLSQQGKTPSQSQQGAAATPSVSTPFSAAQAVFSPHGPRSSPQQVKRSPATALPGSSGRPAVNFDSPSATAALNAPQMGAGPDIGLSSLTLGRASDDGRARRLDSVVSIINVC